MKKYDMTTIMNKYGRMWMVAILFIISYSLFISPVRAQVGTWRNYLSYYEVQQIEAATDGILFVMASNGLYQYNTNDQSIITYDKVSGLSDTNIAHIRWCQQAKQLVIVYSNSNIDLMDTGGNVINVSDIYTKSLTGDKTINNVTINGQYAYLAFGFGIVKVDVKKAEISESYMLGFPVTDIAFDDTNIYANSSDAKWTAPLSSNLIDISNWTKTTTTPSFDADKTVYNQWIETVKTLQPGGPKVNYFGYITFQNNKLYTCSGSGYNGAIQVKNGNEWIIYQDTDLKAITGLNTYRNVRAIAIDPNDENHVFAGSRNGLYEFQDGQLIAHYQQTNSPIEPFNGTAAEYQMVYGVYCDGEYVWCTNCQAPTQSLLRMKMSTHEWESISMPAVMVYNEGSGIVNHSLPYMQNMMKDSQGLVWFVNEFYSFPSIHYFYSDNGKVKSKHYFTFVNQNGLTFNISNGIYQVKEDLNNDLWVLTTDGPLLLSRDDVGTDNPTFTQVIVPRNDGTNYADYLMAGINTSCMDIDGGNRKWIGTKGNGIYLLSSDNMEQIYHFTTSNSPLLSDDIKSISINHTTGEVYIATENGLCSFMSDASEAKEEMKKDDVWAYPNPVEPGYTGLITITGLTFNADVKIVAANGALIAQGRSNGGTFTWDGCDQQGRRVASGVYMVVTATSAGKKGTVCKIAIVR